jgi:hypothetical protein
MGGSTNPGKLYSLAMSDSGLGMPSEVAMLETARIDAGIIALGDWLYVLGGRPTTGTTTLASIERAPLR